MLKKYSIIVVYIFLLWIIVLNQRHWLRKRWGHFPPLCLNPANMTSQHTLGTMRRWAVLGRRVHASSCTFRYCDSSPAGKTWRGSAPRASWRRAHPPGNAWLEESQMLCPPWTGPQSLSLTTGTAQTVPGPFRTRHRAGGTAGFNPVLQHASVRTVPSPL